MRNAIVIVLFSDNPLILEGLSLTGSPLSQAVHGSRCKALVFFALVCFVIVLDQGTLLFFEAPAKQQQAHKPCCHGHDPGT
jgi:hypothetical protein